jgi:hypothetical protein
MFDPSQLSNKYSSMNAMNFPMYNYYGTPTDAMGNPIDSYVPPATPVTPSQGTTLNTNSAAGKFTPVHLPPAYAYDWGNSHSTGYYPSQNDAQQRMAAAKNAVAPAAQATPPTGNLNYLLALANPNKVHTPGVYDYPATPHYQPDSSSIDSIIQGMQSGSMSYPAPPPGIGGGSAGLNIMPSSNFLNTLAALRASSSSATGK